MLIIAIVGIAGNLIGVILLREDSESSLNTKSAYLHLLSDSMSSVAVIICGFIIKFTGFYILDPIIAICISLYIIYESIQTAKQTVDILSQSTPKNINTNKIVEKIKEIDNIKIYTIYTYGRWMNMTLILKLMWLWIKIFQLKKQTKKS